MDLRSNQISMLARLCRAWTIKGQHVDSQGLRSVTELAFAGGQATLLANWSTGDSSKQTSLRWSTGREIFLDHTAMTGYAMVDGAVTDHAGHNGVIGRKAAHYTAMYRALFAGTAEDLLSLELAHLVSALLEAGARAATAAQPRANSTGTR